MPLLALTLLLVLVPLSPARACPYCTNTITELLVSGLVGGELESLLNGLAASLTDVHQALADAPQDAPRATAELLRVWRDFTVGYPTPPPELADRANWGDLLSRGTEVVGRLARLVDAGDADAAALVLPGLETVFDGLFGQAGTWVVAEDWTEAALDGPTLAAAARLTAPAVVSELRSSPTGGHAVLDHPAGLAALTPPAGLSLSPTELLTAAAELAAALADEGISLGLPGQGGGPVTWTMTVEVEDGRQIRRTSRDETTEGASLERVEAAGWADVRFLCQRLPGGETVGIGYCRLGFRTTTVRARATDETQWQVRGRTVEALNPSACRVLTPATFTTGSGR